MSSISFRTIPFLSLTYTELWARFPSRFIISQCLQKPAWSPSRVRVSSLRTKSQKTLSTAVLRTFRRFFRPSSRSFDSRCCGVLRCGCLHVSSLCCHATFISASTTGPAHQLCASCGRLERGTNSKSGKHGVRHVDGDVTAAGVIGGWW